MLKLGRVPDSLDHHWKQRPRGFYAFNACCKLENIKFNNKNRMWSVIVKLTLRRMEIRSGQPSASQHKTMA